MTHKITFYPVGNGDCNLISFSDGASMIVDCNFRQEAEDEDSPYYDVWKELTSEKLNTKFGLPFADASF